jgi:hypothetical protein
MRSIAGLPTAKYLLVVSSKANWRLEICHWQWRLAAVNENKTGIYLARRHQIVACAVAFKSHA